MSSDRLRIPFLALFLLACAPEGPAEPGDLPTLRKLDRELQAAYEAAAPAVVKVFSLRPDGGAVARMGTGFVMDPEGRILTTEAVVSTSSVARIEFFDGRTVPGRVVGSDPALNVALLRIEGGPSDPLPALELPDAAPYRPGCLAIFIGCTIDGGPEPCLGMVSGRRFLRLRLQGLPTWHLRTTIPLRPEQAGGPLLSTGGVVLGMGVENPPGLTYLHALPTDVLRRVVRRILSEGGRIRHSWMGVALESRPPGDSTPDGEIRVAGVRVRSPAQGAGLRAGDRILRIGKVRIRSIPDVFDAMLDVDVGEEVAVEIEREGRNRVLTVRTAERPEFRMHPPMPVPSEVLPGSAIESSAGTGNPAADSPSEPSPAPPQ